jgi:hypothetical protein
MKPIKKKLFALYLDNRLYQVLSTQMFFDVHWDISGKLFNDLHDKMLTVSQRVENRLVKERRIGEV